MAQLAAMAVEDLAGQCVAGLAPVELSEDAAPVGLVVEVGQQEDRLGNAAHLGEG